MQHHINSIISRYQYPQPSISLFREASFGHGELEVVNSTHTQWTWHRNDDDEAVVSDQVWLQSLAANTGCSAQVQISFMLARLIEEFAYFVNLDSAVCKMTIYMISKFSMQLQLHDHKCLSFYKTKQLRLHQSRKFIDSLVCCMSRGVETGRVKLDNSLRTNLRSSRN